MPKYGIGDRVEHNGFGYGNVIAIDIDDWIGVEFDNSSVPLHSCACQKLKEGHPGRMNHCFWFIEDDISLKLVKKAKKEKTEMTGKCDMEIKKVSYDRSGVNGKTITCRLEYFIITPNGPEIRSRVVSDEANCAPDDTFDFKVGMDLAYDRAYAKAVEVVKQINNPPMRFVCVKSGNDFKSGSIYSAHYDSYGHPYVVDDEGDRRPTAYGHINLVDFMDWMFKSHLIRLED